jgi:hypothetical protein
MHVHPVRVNEDHDGESITEELGRREIAMPEGPGKLPRFDRLMTPTRAAGQ